MKRGPIASGAATVFAAAGLGLGLAASAGAATVRPAAAQTAAQTAATQYVLVNCESKAQVRPGSYVLACADGNNGLQGLHWASWTPRLASGYGTNYMNDCKPNCAEGHFHYYAALVVAWGSGSVSGHPGERRYTEVTLVAPGARPPVHVLENGKVVTTYPLTQTFPAL